MKLASIKNTTFSSDTACDAPPPTPTELNLEPIWDGQPIPFDTTVSFRCKNGRKFADDYDLQTIDFTCRKGNLWDLPAGGFKACVSSKQLQKRENRRLF